MQIKSYNITRANYFWPVFYRIKNILLKYLLTWQFCNSVVNKEIPILLFTTLLLSSLSFYHKMYSWLIIINWHFLRSISQTNRLKTQSNRFLFILYCWKRSMACEKTTTQMWSKHVSLWDPNESFLSQALFERNRSFDKAQKMAGNIVHWYSHGLLWFGFKTLWNGRFCVLTYCFYHVNA